MDEPFYRCRVAVGKSGPPSQRHEETQNVPPLTGWVCVRKTTRDVEKEHYLLGENTDTDRKQQERVYNIEGQKGRHTHNMNDDDTTRNNNKGNKNCNNNTNNDRGLTQPPRSVAWCGASQQFNMHLAIERLGGRRHYRCVGVRGVWGSMQVQCSACICTRSLWSRQ